MAAGKQRVPGDAEACISKEVNDLLAKYSVAGCQISLLYGQGLGADISCGLAMRPEEKQAAVPLLSSTMMEVASLSKSIASAFAAEYFADRDIPMSTPVQELLEKCGSSFRLELDRSVPDGSADWPGQVQLRHLMDHTGLGMHYVNGIPLDEDMPSPLDLLQGKCEANYGYAALKITKPPGERFGYSGGGFIVLQHLIETMEGKPVEEVCRQFLNSLGMSDFHFSPRDQAGRAYAKGYADNGKMVPGGRLMFPAFAAGALGTARSLANFFQAVLLAHRGGGGPLRQSTAQLLLEPEGADKGDMAFMAARMALGVFVARAGPNHIAVHQAANEGFRGVYVVCVNGPDVGKGFVVLSNGDNQAALLNAEVCRVLLGSWSWQGLNNAVLQGPANFLFEGLKQEEIVNQAYKRLVFDAFQQDGDAESNGAKRQKTA